MLINQKKAGIKEWKLSLSGEGGFLPAIFVQRRSYFRFRKKPTNVGSHS